MPGVPQVQIVPDKSLDQPALTLRGAATDVVGVIACENVELAHFFDIAVIEIKFDVPGVEASDLDRKTGPEHAAVSLGGAAVAADIEAAALPSALR